MKLRHPLWIRIAAFGASGLVRAWMSSVRPRYALLGPEVHPVSVRKQRYIYLFWHESLLFMTPFREPSHILISHHADGELIAQVCQFLRIGVVRGSTTRGGSQGLLELVRKSRQTHLALTPDGPRGPRRRVQAGAIALASLTGLPIVPIGIASEGVWRANSWDRFMIPKPGSAAYYATAPAISVPKNLDREQMERFRLEAEQRLGDATTRAELWAAGGRRPGPAPPTLDSRILSACA